jgi:hypothetical protein
MLQKKTTKDTVVSIIVDSPFARGPSTLAIKITSKKFAIAEATLTMLVLKIFFCNLIS